MTQKSDKNENIDDLNKKPIYEKPILTHLSADKTESGPTPGAENGFSSS